MEETDEGHPRTIPTRGFPRRRASHLPADRGHTIEEGSRWVWTMRGNRRYIQTGPGNEADVRFPRLSLPRPGSNGIKGSFFVLGQKSEPIDFSGICIVLVALIKPEDMVARIGSVPPDCLQLGEKIKEVSGLVDDEGGVYDALDRVAQHIDCGGLGFVGTLIPITYIGFLSAIR